MTVRLGRLVEQVTSISASRPLPFLALERLDAGSGAVLAGVELSEVAPDPSGMLQFAVGDVLFGKLRPYLAKSWLADRDGFCSTELIAMRPRPEVIESRWLAYLVQSRPFVGWAVATSDGVKMPRTSWEKLRLYAVTAPSLGEQRAIAEYLDREVSRLAALISLRESQADLVATHVAAAVDAILESLGPWVPLRHVLAPERDSLIAGPFGSQLAGDDLRENGMAGVVDQEVIIGKSFDLPKHYVDASKWDELRRFEVKAGDVLVSGRGTTGRVAVAPDGNGPAIIHPSVLRVRPDPRRLSAEFLAICLRWSSRIRDYLRLENTATTIDVIYSGTLRGVPIPIPSLIEQEEALGHIVGVASDGGSIGQAMRMQVALLDERRQALITAAVTGQLEIPGVAA